MKRPVSYAMLCAALALSLGACTNRTAPPVTDEPAAPVLTSVAATASATVTSTRAASSAPSATPILGFLATPTPSAAAASAAPALSQQQLQQVSLATTDLPAGFAITASGPGGPELGRDVRASYQEEFQQRDVTSTQSLQQTIVIINLLGAYTTPSAAAAGIKALSAQSLNQILGSVNLSAEPATIPPIEEDSQAFHFSGDANGISVGGYLIVFHRGPNAALILTAAVKGAESLPQTLDLAQKQALKFRAAG